ncbi:GSCOCG00004134001-RA-CDS [Cotesia congregata]|nr:GSCOCG00004134001-RA-CDS [Cotesia congregata]
MREALKIMRQHKNEAHIININSTFGINGTTQLPINVYPASKFALRGMTDTFKAELEFSKVTSIRVTSIHVGLTSTEIFGDSALFNKVKSKFPNLKSSDIAGGVVFVLSMPSYVQLDEIKVTAKLNK